MTDTAYGSGSVKGQFITIEGQDGAGKSTNLDFIKSYLESKNLNVHTTREPGGTKLGEQLRDILLYGNDLGCVDSTELLLMFASRSQHLHEVIYPKLDSGTWVVSDRFTDATYAYQGAGRGVSFEQIRVLENLVQNTFRPILTFVLDIPLDIAKSRGANDGDDRFENQKDSFKHRVRDYYLSLCEKQSDRVKRIDASLDIEQVQAQIIEQLEMLLEKVTTP